MKTTDTKVELAALCGMAAGKAAKQIVTNPVFLPVIESLVTLIVGGAVIVALARPVLMIRRKRRRRRR